MYRYITCSPAEYADERRGLIGEDASGELRPGLGRLPQLVDDGSPTSLGAGEPTRGDTVHLDVADRFGNLLSATPSGGWLQSSPTIPELGWPLGTRAQMFWLEEGLPSSLAPRKRPAHDALAGPRAPRRRAVARLRDAGRRPAGAVGAARPRAPRRSRARPAGGDRRARVAHRPPDLVVLPARVRGPLARRSSRGSATRRSPTCGAAATTSLSRGRGRSAASAPSRARATSSSRPRTRAECRATPSRGRYDQA